MSSLVDLKHFVEDNDIMGKTVTREISWNSYLKHTTQWASFKLLCDHDQIKTLI